MVIWNSIDTWMVLIALCIAVSSTCIGMHFVLNRESLISDAISHSVLPGIAIAYIITGLRLPLPMFIGAIIAGLFATMLINFIIKQSRIDPSTSMGVVFSGFFAVGLLLISNVASTVDLDPSCVLFGSLELTPLETVQIASLDIPHAFITNASVMIFNIVFLLLLFRIITTVTFDSYFATSIGMPVRFVRMIQILLITVTSVAAFESVGSILIIAFLIIPPIVGWLFSITIKRMFFISLITAILSSYLGHVIAIYIPPFFGIDDISSTGSIVTILGVFLLIAALFSPRMGFVIISINKIKNAVIVASYDILKTLYINKNTMYRRIKDFKRIHNQSFVAGKLGIMSIILAIRVLRYKKYIVYSTQDGFITSEEGDRKAQEIIEQHRAWETYLYLEGMSPEEIHLSAEQLEHSNEVNVAQKIQKSKHRIHIPGHNH